MIPQGPEILSEIEYGGHCDDVSENNGTFSHLSSGALPACSRPRGLRAMNLALFTGTMVEGV